MKRSKIYLNPTEDSKWEIKKQDNVKATKIFGNKNNALEFGRNLAKDQKPSQLIIKKQDGRIQTEHTYGKDPYPPKG
ncbi:MAG: DUF2188 domain-containing protein [Candidatus Humimicrobiaceae bacterium]